MRIEAVRRWAGELQRLVLPEACAGCGVAGSPICVRCTAALAPVPVRRTAARLPVTASLVYDGVARRVVIAVKNEGRTACAPPLARALLAAVATARTGDAVIVPMPATRRSAVERGYDPVRLLLRRAGLDWRDHLRLARRSADQVRLDRAGRLANVAGGMAARGRLDGRTVLLVDDVVTTGATLGEAARAIRAAGGQVLGAAVIAATPRR